MINYTDWATEFVELERRRDAIDQQCRVHTERIAARSKTQQQVLSIVQSRHEKRFESLTVENQSAEERNSKLLDNVQEIYRAVSDSKRRDSVLTSKLRRLDFHRPAPSPQVSHKVSHVAEFFRVSQVEIPCQHQRQQQYQKKQAVVPSEASQIFQNAQRNPQFAAGASTSSSSRQPAVPPAPPVPQQAVAANRHDGANYGRRDDAG